MRRVDACDHSGRAMNAIWLRAPASIGSNAAVSCRCADDADVNADNVAVARRFVDPRHGAFLGNVPKPPLAVSEGLHLRVAGKRLWQFLREEVE